MTNYKILINSKGVPVLVQLAGVEQYEREIALAVADDSKHIAFKSNSDLVYHLWESMGDVGKKLWDDSINPKLWLESKAGQTFDLPENISVSFWCNADCDVNHGECCHPSSCQELKRAILTPKPESVPSCGDGWISVKDRLPELAKQVCITLEMDGNARAAKSYPGFRANGGWYVFTIPDKSWVPHDDKHYKITYWQPLPKAPTIK